MVIVHSKIEMKNIIKSICIHILMKFTSRNLLLLLNDHYMSKYLIHSRPFKNQPYTIPYYFSCLLHLFILFLIYSNRMVSKCGCYLIKQMSSSFAYSLVSPLSLSLSSSLRLLTFTLHARFYLTYCRHRRMHFIVELLQWQ